MNDININNICQEPGTWHIQAYFVTMKRIMTIMLLVLVAAFSQAQKKYLGGDISLLSSYEAQGTVYKDYNGKQVRLLPFLREQGWNTIRVRLFVDPQNAPEEHKGEGVCQDLNYVIAFCQEIKKAGMQIMLDFHYSDTWADPGKQFTPKRWGQADSQQLADSVYAYTKSSLQAMKRAGVEPELIQVGNEITNGMLWPIGHIDPAKDDNWDTLGSFLRSGSKACREICPKAQIIIHTEKAGDWGITYSYYQHLQQQQIDYDIIGLSYYPMWHGTIPNLAINLQRLSEYFPDKPVMIVETAAYYSHENDPWAKPEQYAEFYPISKEGQMLFTHELVTEIKKHNNVIGLFWWFPEENAFGNNVVKGWLNRGLFDNHTGQVMPAMKEYNKFLP